MATERCFKNWIRLGELLIFIFCLWAADWWSKKLFITVPMGLVAYFSIALASASDITK